MVSAKAKHPTCAYKWLDWIISPKTNAQVAEYFGEAPANARSCAETADKNHCTVFHASDEAYWKRVHFWTTPIEQCLDGRTDAHCVPYAKWVQAWTEIKG
jgi:putative spermidine/putrescine transport system substrate-binding protein